MNLAESLKAAQLPSPETRRAIRVAAGATLRDIADELGVTPQAVYFWEVGRSTPRREQAAAYRRLLDELRTVAA
jgi:DNA-binding XRE family transcriptional regulator